MSKPRQPDPALLIVALLYRPDFELDFLISRLERNFGKIIEISEPFSFDFSDYYEAEMGPNLLKRFFVFSELIDPARLAKIKQVTDVVEDDFRDTSSNRTVNLDPGYLNAAHLILATGKGFSHRPYLGRQVYADLTLMWQDGKFFTLAWTYPDYADAKAQETLTGFRKRYLLLLREHQRGMEEE